MAQISNIILPNGHEVKIQVVGTSSGEGCSYDPLDKVKEIAQEKLQNAIADIGMLVSSTAETVRNSVNSLNVESITVTAGVAVSAEGGIILVKGSTEVNFEISVTFKVGD